jgi:hypothetical protein
MFLKKHDCARLAERIEAGIESWTGRQGGTLEVGVLGPLAVEVKSP